MSKSSTAPARPLVWNGRTHPVADVFPMLGDKAAAALADSISEHGLLHAVTLAPDGTLLDGRNRMKACEAAGVALRFVAHDGDPVRFIVASNLHRRHLTTSQRAMVAEELANLQRGDNQYTEDTPNGGTSQSAAAELLNVSPRGSRR